MERDEFVICNGAGCCCCAALKGNMCNALSNHKTHNEEKIQIGAQKSQKKNRKKIQGERANEGVVRLLRDTRGKIDRR